MKESQVFLSELSASVVAIRQPASALGLRALVEASSELCEAQQQGCDQHHHCPCLGGWLGLG